MSKPKEHPALNDWEVHLSSGSTVIIASSWWAAGRRGAYTFCDETGIAYDFPPGAVEYVCREVGHSSTPLPAAAIRALQERLHASAGNLEAAQ